MSLQHLNFSAIGEADLGRLVSDGIAESKTLEYKEALVIATDEQKQEFLSDITALANTDGGDLVFGMKAEKGVANELVGLRNLIPDEVVGRIENLLRDFVQPRLAGVQIRAIPLTDGTHALLVRVPHSFAAPHMVRHQGVTRFCGRNSNGKYDLDVQELRSAFLANEALADRLKAFRLDRINKLISGSSPVLLDSHHLLVLHVLPVASARPDVRFGAADFSRIVADSAPRLIGGSSGLPVFNFDGLLSTGGPRQNRFLRYVQVFRSGFLEAVDSALLDPARNTQAVIPTVWERGILEGYSGCLKTFAALGLPPPYVVSVSLLNVLGFAMQADPRWSNDDVGPVDRDHLLTDETLVESNTVPAPTVFRPLFDQVWNACGWEGSINYDEAGNWREHR
jgi:hypothetical protein